MSFPTEPEDRRVVLPVMNYHSFRISLKHVLFTFEKLIYWFDVYPIFYFKDEDLYTCIDIWGCNMPDPHRTGNISEEQWKKAYDLPPSLDDPAIFDQWNKLFSMLPAEEQEPLRALQTIRNL